MIVRYPRPGYCWHCGEPFPWTAEALVALRELATEAEVPPEQTEQWIEAAKHLGDVDEGPVTVAATQRFKRFARKLGPDLYDAAIQIGVSIASDAVKKSLGG